MDTGKTTQSDVVGLQMCTSQLQQQQQSSREDRWVITPCQHLINDKPTYSVRCRWTSSGCCCSGGEGGWVARKIILVVCAATNRLSADWHRRRGLMAVVKVRGPGGLRPLLRFEPPAIVWAPSLDWICKVLFYA